MRLMNNKNIKLDILAIGAHPDDVEAGCAGFLIKYTRMGKKVGIVDLSLAELSTNGTVSQRLKEADEARKIIGAVVRENLKFPNNFFSNNKESQLKVVKVIRKYKPDILLMPYWIDRHPDHQDVKSVVWSALFSAGLRKIKTNYPPHRPKFVFFYRMWYGFEPTFILDISDIMAIKKKALMAYRSQVLRSMSSHKVKGNGDEFIDAWEARHIHDGFEIGVKYGEAYKSLTPIGITDLNSFLPNYS